MRKDQWGRTTRGLGFTLIELLVVVAIVAVLMSILMPSLARARRQAWGLRCLAQCRQLGQGIHHYHNEFGLYPAHKWGFADGSSFRWYQALAHYVAGFEVQQCPSTPEWEVGRNNSYGYNYKYLGSARTNTDPNNPYAPYESFPIREVHAASRTIAFADSDGTGWEFGWEPGKDPDCAGNHGYTLDPTYIPVRSLTTVNSEGVLEPYAWKHYRTYVSDRHLGKSSFIFADGHGEHLTPQEVYADNSLWNGLGFDPADNPDSHWYDNDQHVDYRRHEQDGHPWRYPGVE